MKHRDLFMREAVLTSSPRHDDWRHYPTPGACLTPQTVDEGLVGAIYDVASGDGDWAEALERLCAACGAACALMACLDADGRYVERAERAALSGRQFAADYLGSAYRSDPWLRLLLDAPIGRVIESASTRVVPDAATQHFHSVFLDAHLLGGSAHVKLAEDATTLTACVLFRSVEDPPFAPGEVFVLQRYVEHMAIALGVQRRMERAQADVMLSRRILEAGDRPMIVMTDEGKQLTSNRLGRDFVALGRFLVAHDDDRLSGSSAAAQANFERLLADLRKAPPDSSQPQVLRLPGEDGSVALCSVWRLPPQSGSHADLAAVDQGEPVAGRGSPTRWLLTALDPRAEYVPDQSFVRDAFGLTEAEARVASLVAGGYSLKEIAAMNAVSLNTVRGQLATVMNKTGTSRQAELVARILHCTQS